MKKPERNDLNRGNKRNLRNMSGNRRGWFNCAGYALNTFSWYCPDAKHTKSGKDRAQKLLDDFPDLRIIKTVEELLPDEYAIAFRTSKTDFHFIKRCDNGQWRHKRGRSYDIEYMSTKEVFSARWCESRPDPYDGTIWLFAKKKPLPAARRHLDVIRLTCPIDLLCVVWYHTLDGGGTMNPTKCLNCGNCSAVEVSHLLTFCDEWLTAETTYTCPFCHKEWKVKYEYSCRLCDVSRKEIE